MKMQMKQILEPRKGKGKRTRYYQPTKQCQLCKGMCCKQLPAPYSPFDIKKLFPAETFIKSIALAINSNTIAIDWWEGNNPLPFLRPKTKNNQRSIYDPSWGGECIHLTDSGCNLKFENRPHYCKTLEPKEPDCDAHLKVNSKLTAAKAWRKTKIDLFQWRKND